MMSDPKIEEIARAINAEALGYGITLRPKTYRQLARAAYEVMARSDGWLPIEDAPRDEETYVLAMREGAKVPFVASYDADYDNWFTFNGALENCGQKFEPTHWRPLPDPPSPPLSEEEK